MTKQKHKLMGFQEPMSIKSTENKREIHVHIGHAHPTFQGEKTIIKGKSSLHTPEGIILPGRGAIK